MFKTGDLSKNINSLILILKQIKFPTNVTTEMLNCGKPEIFLPIIHYTLFNYSEKVAQYLYDNNYDIYAKNDLDFINSVFLCLIKLFNYKPLLNSNQFFKNGFVEGKVILCYDIINLVIEKNKELNKNNYNNKKNINNNNNKKEEISPRFNSNNINNNNNNNNNKIIIEKNPKLLEQNYYDIETGQINNTIPTPMPNISQKFINTNSTNNDNNINNSIKQSSIEIYDSSQDFPLVNHSVYDSSVASMNNNNNNNSSNINNVNNNNNSINNNNNIEINTLVQVITSLSTSVSQMVSKIENFKNNVENRLNKIEAEIILIKNRQNIVETKYVNNNSLDICETNNNNSAEFGTKNVGFSFSNDNNNLNNQKNLSNYSQNKLNINDGNIITTIPNKIINNNNNNNIDLINSLNNEKKYNNNYINYNTYSYSNNNNIYQNNIKGTNELIENVEKKFQETRNLLSNLK